MQLIVLATDGLLWSLSRPKWSWLAALLVLVATQSDGADICAAKTTWPESAICSNPSVSDLDDQLNTIYRLVREASSEKEPLRKEQLQWLRAVRNACRDDECLIKTYRGRVADLSGRFATLMAISEQPLSTAEARQACDAVAQLASNGQLEQLAIPPVWSGEPERENIPSQWTLSAHEQEVLERGRTYALGVQLLRTDANQPPRRFVQLDTGGSCSSLQLFDVTQALAGAEKGDPQSSAVETVDDPQDLLRWAYWGGGDFPIVYQRHLFLATSAIEDRNQVQLLSWVKPDGVVRPLCLMKKTNVSKAVTKAALPALCAQVADGRLSPLAGEDIIDQIDRNNPLYASDRGRQPERAYRLQVDLDGDGKNETLGHFEYDSGAGCGGVDSWLKLLSADVKAGVETALSAPIATLSRGSLEVYGYDGHYYFASHTDGHRDGLVQVSEGKVEQVCEFKPLAQHDVSQFFSLPQ